MVGDGRSLRRTDIIDLPTGIYCGMRAEGLIDARLLGDVRFLNLRRKPALV